MNLKSLIPSFRPALSETIFPHVALTSGTPGLLTEFRERPDHVLLAEPGKSCLLATLDVLDRTFSLSFEPKHASNPVAMLWLIKAGSREVSYELPELGERANYRQVTALAQYRFVVAQMRKATTGNARVRTGMPWWGIGLVMVLAFLTSVLLLTDPGQAAVKTSPVAASKPAESVAAVSSSGDQLNEVEKKILAQTVGASGIELRSGGKPFVIFSDPNCPACRQLEARLADIDKSLSPVVVPVAFKSNSAEAVATVLCAKDVASAWRSAVVAQESYPAGCETGQKQATANNAAFVALRFDRTPTIVAANGKVAVGAKDFDGLMRWLKENSGG